MRNPWIIALGLCLAACAPNLPTVTPTPTASPTAASAAVTPTERLPLVTPQRPTLPPTWTPTFTPSASATPTITPTPSITPTPTPIPEAALCAAFALIKPVDGLLYRAGDALAFSLYVPFDTVFIVFRAAGAAGDPIEATLPGGQQMVFRLAPERFPTSGRYDWTFSLTTSAASGLCSQRGFFIIDNTPVPTATSTAEATPESTPESTAEATPESTPESTAEATAEITPESTAEATPESTPTRIRPARTPTPTATRRP